MCMCLVYVCICVYLISLYVWHVCLLALIELITPCTNICLLLGPTYQILRQR